MIQSVYASFAMPRHTWGDALQCLYGSNEHCSTQRAEQATKLQKLVIALAAKGDLHNVGNMLNALCLQPLSELWCPPEQS